MSQYSNTALNINYQAWKFIFILQTYVGCLLLHQISLANIFSVKGLASWAHLHLYTTILTGLILCSSNVDNPCYGQKTSFCISLPHPPTLTFFVLLLPWCPLRWPRVDLIFFFLLGLSAQAIILSTLASNASLHWLIPTAKRSFFIQGWD